MKLNSKLIKCRVYQQKNSAISSSTNEKIDKGTFSMQLLKRKLLGDTLYGLSSF